MKGHLQGLLTFLDLMAEGSRRQADLIAGGGFNPRPELQVVTAPVERKIPLSRHQILRLLATRPASKVSIEH